jgi:hypothetical protein
MERENGFNNDQIEIGIGDLGKSHTETKEGGKLWT